MKLFSRYSSINLLANILIFLIASIAFYFSIKFVLINQIDEDLEIEENEITAYVSKYNRLPDSYSFSDQIIAFSERQSKGMRRFANEEMMDKEDQVLTNFRTLTFSIQANAHHYQVNVSKSLEGTNKLLWSILSISISTILVILLVSAIINRVLLKNLWKPFYQSLQAVSHFRVSKNQALVLPSSNIEEFAILNDTLDRIANNSRLEYAALKTFSENASHEIQTPIAIIRSKLDLLIQDEQLNENGSKLLQGAYNAIDKLSRLNESLLLLAKIGNNQFEALETVDLKQKLSDKVEDFRELWQSKSITPSISLDPATVNMNPQLADILLNNLLSNATNHNYQGGSLTIRLTKDELTIGNTSRTGALDTKKVFQRFYKPSQSDAHNGLGLSIIKQIADVSGFTLRYAYEKSEHRLWMDLNHR